MRTGPPSLWGCRAPYFGTAADGEERAWALSGQRSPTGLGRHLRSQRSSRKVAWRAKSSSLMAQTTRRLRLRPRSGFRTTAVCSSRSSSWWAARRCSSSLVGAIASAYRYWSTIVALHRAPHGWAHRRRRRPRPALRRAASRRSSCRARLASRCSWTSRSCARRRQCTPVRARTATI